MQSKSIRIIGKNKAAEMDRHSFGTCIIPQKEQIFAIFNIIGKMNIFRSEHEGHDIMNINSCFEARQDEIEKYGGQNDQL